ncbi:WD40-repeat-containing domain protein [Suillus clintonianus]|uniref:WD40-repeat-containing domain protein n=1 Tax=Suillus clintonianus TaxID=1904413 RepID=UPI001B87761E|nr:WD40-repeat-containing domain protein [Suillus clintonianus]KAG2130354.1 WD40-repeat-containing domain protein [Suillus clintonianus]
MSSEYSSVADAITPTCTTLKRTPSRANVSSTYSTRKRRRVSVASFDLGRDLATPLVPATPIEETNADRFVTVRTSTSLPLNITPRTNRIAKTFGLLDDRVLSPNDSPSRSSDPFFRSLLRRSASELFSTPRAASLLSAKANLGTRKHFVMALDGPGMSTDLFASPMAWSHANCIGVAFKYDVYFQNLESRAVVHLCRSSLSDGTVHSIDWGGKANPYLLALGTTAGDVRVMDAEKKMQLVDWVDGSHGMGGMHWNGDVLAVGRTGGNVSLFDIRTRAEITKIMGHKRRVHGVKWSADGRHLATGDDSGIVHVWDHRANDLLTNGDKNIRMKHKGPVKALSWSPWQSGLLASGGGSPDGEIHVWNTGKMTPSSGPMHTISLQTTITSLHWSPHCKELLSTHGSSWAAPQSNVHPAVPQSNLRPIAQASAPCVENSLAVHSYPSCQRVVNVKAHSAPVGHSCMGPDGCSVFTVSPIEETIKMFRVWSAPDDKEKSEDSDMTLRSTIR